MGHVLRALLGGLLLLLAAGCTMEGAINRLSSAEDRAFAQTIVEDIRSGEAARLRPQFDPELWAKSREQLANARTLFPAGAGETRLIGYNISTNVDTSGSRTEKQFTLVTTDGSHWTQTEVTTLAENAPARVVSWNVQGFDRPPPELESYETMEKALPVLQGVAALFVLGLTVLIFWLVRRSRRRAMA